MGADLVMHCLTIASFSGLHGPEFPLLNHPLLPHCFVFSAHACLHRVDTLELSRWSSSQVKISTLMLATTAMCSCAPEQEQRFETCQMSPR